MAWTDRWWLKGKVQNSWNGSDQSKEMTRGDFGNMAAVRIDGINNV
jgi:hypothetical protein